MFQLLILDHDKNSLRYYKTLLFRNGFHVLCSESISDAMKTLDTYRINLLILNLYAPDSEEISFIRTLHECRNDILILSISSHPSPLVMKQAFLAGADDYMKTPMNEEEFIFHIRALLRRTRIFFSQQLCIGSTILNADTFTVTVNAAEEILPPKEFLLLYKLLSNPNQIFSRIQLMNDIWGHDSNSMETTVSVHINRLRKRYKNNPDFKIYTLRGIGYKACLTRET